MVDLKNLLKILLNFFLCETSTFPAKHILCNNLHVSHFLVFPRTMCIKHNKLEISCL